MGSRPCTAVSAKGTYRTLSLNFPPLTSGLVKHYINYKYINTGVNAVSWLHLRPVLPHNDSPRVNDFKNPLETLPVSQVERLLRGPVRRQHVGGLRGLHGRRDGDV